MDFLQPHATMIEICWKKWNCFYAMKARTTGRKVKVIMAEKTHYNWRHFQAEQKHIQLSREDKLNRTKYQNVKSYKWVDVTVNVDVFTDNIKKVVRG